MTEIACVPCVLIPMLMKSSATNWRKRWSMDRESAIAEAIKEVAEMYGRELDASERSIVRFGFAHGAMWCSAQALDASTKRLAELGVAETK